jgi:hypothetical protein
VAHPRAAVQMVPMGMVAPMLIKWVLVLLIVDSLVVGGYSLHVLPILIHLQDPPLFNSVYVMRVTLAVFNPQLVNAPYVTQDPFALEELRRPLVPLVPLVMEVLPLLHSLLV